MSSAVKSSTRRVPHHDLAQAAHDVVRISGLGPGRSGTPASPRNCQQSANTTRCESHQYFCWVSFADQAAVGKIHQSGSARVLFKLVHPEAKLNASSQIPRSRQTGCKRSSRASPDVEQRPSSSRWRTCGWASSGSSCPPIDHGPCAIRLSGGGKTCRTTAAAYRLSGADGLALGRHIGQPAGRLKLQ